jgi:hypothetical protein
VLRRLVLLFWAMMATLLMVGGVAQAEVLLGTDGPDWLVGTVDDDRISGLGSDDYVQDAPTDDGPSGNDSLSGGEGDDSIHGSAATTPSPEDRATKTLAVAWAATSSRATMATTT